MREFYIDDELVFVEKGWNVSDKINARTTASFSVFDLLELEKINIGSKVEIYDVRKTEWILSESEESENVIYQWEDTATWNDDYIWKDGKVFENVLIFAGTVETIEELETDPGFIDYRITAVDYSALADRRLVADSLVDKFAGEIIIEDLLPILSEEGVTAGNIEEGGFVSKSVFNYVTVTDALNYLKNLTGFVWEIDFDRKLNFYRRDTNLAPFVLSDKVQHHSFVKNKTRNQYRNIQYLRAGTGRTAPQTLERPTPKPDGVSRNFVTRFPVAEKPKIFIDSVEVDPDDIGVNGLDKDKKFYFSFASNVISQDEEEPVLNDVDLQITYTGLFPILVRADGDEQINLRAQVEAGTSGKYERLDTERSINEIIQASQFAQGLIEKYGIIPTTITFETEVDGLEAGQLLEIKKDLYGIDDSFLIEEINIAADGPKTIYSVKCLDGTALGGWEEFFRELLKGKREFAIQENEVVVLLNIQAENVGYKGTNRIILAEPLLPSNELFPSEELTPGTLIEEVFVND